MRNIGLFNFGPMSSKIGLGLLSLLGVLAFEILKLSIDRKGYVGEYHDILLIQTNRYQLYEAEEQAEVTTGRGTRNSGYLTWGHLLDRKGFSGSVSVS